MTTKLGALIMAALLVLYLALVGWRAVQFMATGEPIAIAMGVALLVLPLIALWALWRELSFGIHSHELVKRLDAEGGLDLELPLMPSGRPERAAATAALDGFRAVAAEAPESWQAALRLGLAYDAAGDRKSARQSVRHAIELSRAER